MKKTFWLSCFIGIVCSCYLLYSNTYRTTPRVVFCNVGQGDATYIRLPTGINILIDTGPDVRVLGCLDKELPYFDRSIELVFITHAQKDHMGGLVSIEKNYHIHQIAASVYFKNPSVSAVPLAQGDTITLGLEDIIVLWPPRNLSTNLKTDTSLNNTALILQITIKNKEILLLSDVDSTEGERALSSSTHQQTILKISHHGSKYGTSKKLLLLADPTVAVISVGKNNLYGHPHASVTALLKALNIPVRRTDKDGNVTIVL